MRRSLVPVLALVVACRTPAGRLATAPDTTDNAAAAAADGEMNNMGMAADPHMSMTPTWPLQPGDSARARAIVAAVRASLAKYRGREGRRGGRVQGIPAECETSEGLPLHELAERGGDAYQLRPRDAHISPLYRRLHGRHDPGGRPVHRISPDLARRAQPARAALWASRTGTEHVTLVPAAPRRAGSPGAIPPVGGPSSVPWGPSRPRPPVTVLVAGSSRGSSGGWCT